jgi:hypothetical protein
MTTLLSEGAELPFPAATASNSCLVFGENMPMNPDPREEGPKPCSSDRPGRSN